MQKRKNTKLQNVIYNIQTISKIVFVYLCKTLRFLCKKAKNRAFCGGVFALKCPKNHETHLFGWVFVLVHQVFDVDSHAEDGAGVDKYLAEEHQHRAVYLACGRKCQ